MNDVVSGHCLEHKVPPTISESPSFRLMNIKPSHFCQICWKTLTQTDNNKYRTGLNRVSDPGIKMYSMGLEGARLHEPQTYLFHNFNHAFYFSNELNPCVKFEWILVIDPLYFL